MGVHVCVDVGGTFTDLFAVDDENGTVLVGKTLTSADGVGGVLAAMDETGIEPARVATFILGSTRATNAVAEGRLAPVVFLASDGFSDTLEIRRLWREHIFGWQWDRPAALVPRDLRFGVPGRIDAGGREIAPLDLAAVDRAVDAARRRGITAYAVSLLFAFLDPVHEHRVRDRIREKDPGAAVFLGSDVNPEIKDYERGSTTVVAAALSPIVDGLLGDLGEGLARHGVTVAPQVIKSNGGIMSAASARAKPIEIIRSGPAGGVASLARFARDAGLPNLIGIDIGGTTADVSVISDGAVGTTQQASLAWDIPIRVAMADVRSIGAGGGSIAWLDGAGSLHVGPRSAGADPGPACYGRGGREPTVTDAALVAGLLDPDRFLGGRMRVDPAAAHAALRARVAEPLGLTPRDAAGGVLRLVTARMAQLIGEMTVQVGLDPRDYTLVGFGGAGPLFAAALADEIEAAGAIVPRHPGVWSAIGGLFADTVHDYAKSLVAPLASVDLGDLDGVAGSLAAMAVRDLVRDGLEPTLARFAFALDLRYAGQSHELSVAIDGGPPFSRATLAAAVARFEDLHERTYAHRRPEDPCVMTAVRLQARSPRRLDLPAEGAIAAPRPPTQRAVAFHGHGLDLPTRVLDRTGLAPGTTVEGPAVVEEEQSTTVVPPGHRLVVAAAGHLEINRRSP